MKHTIEIETNPAGYSGPCYGYIIRHGDRMWRDGGYATAKQAREDAKNDWKKIKAAHQGV